MVEHHGSLHQKAGVTEITFLKAAITETKSVLNDSTRATLNMHVVPK